MVIRTLACSMGWFFMLIWLVPLAGQ
jgi:hypothetical protein